MQDKTTILKWISILNPFLKTRNRFKISILMIITLGLFSNLTFAQLATEEFSTGIPASWAVTSNQTVANNWVPTTATGGYLSTPGVSVNPSLNNTVGTTAEYFLITPQFLTPQPDTEVRFFTKQGSFTNRGTIYQVRLSVADQPDLDSFNVVLATWTEAQLNVSATTWEEKIVTIPDLPQGIPIYLAFVAITQQTGTTGTSGDTWFIDNARVITSCESVTGITSTMSTNGGVINWTHPSATNFEIQIVPQGSGYAPTGTLVTGTSYNASGLANGTAYDVYIKAICDAATSSGWAGPFSIQTAISGLNCASPIVIPSDVSTTPYVLSSNLANYFSMTDYTSYTTVGSNCFPVGTSNQLSGNHIFFNYTPTTTGLINISQAVNVVSGGGGNNCYNGSSSVMIFNSCADVGVSCLAGMMTSGSATTSQINDFYVEAGNTYVIVMSSPYPHGINSNAGICFTFTVSGSTCPSPSPSGTTYENLTQTSASFSWTNNGNLVDTWEYVALPIASGAPNGSTILTTTNTNLNNLASSLSANTEYNLYVRSVCGGIPGAWSVPFVFKTLCNTFTLPYYTGFNTGDATVDCWSQLNLNNDSNFFNFGNDAGIGGGREVAKIRPVGSDDMLISPQLHFDGVTQKRLRFKYNIYGNWGPAVNPTPGPGSFEVKLSTTGVGPQNFTTTIIPLDSYTTGYDYIEKIVPLPLGLTGDVNIAWILPAGATQTGGQTYFEDVYIEDLPACSEPAYPVVTLGSITTNSVNISWTNGYNNTQWQLVAQPLGTGVPTLPFVAGAVVNIVNTNPYTITGLNPSTQYEFYMRAYCNATEQSIWVGPIQFDTNCIEQPTPYYENLNDNDITSKKFCWTTNNVGGDPAKWTIDTTEARIWPQPVNFFQPFVSYDDWLISVPVNAVGPKRLRFDYRVVTTAFYPTPRGNFEVLMSSTPDFASYTVLIPSYDFTNSAYQQNTVLFTGTGTTYIAFRLPPTMSNPSGTGMVMVDNVIIDDAPACPDPTQLTATNIAQTTADLSWTTGYSETQWQIVVQNIGSGVPTGSGTTVNSTPLYNASNLTPDTLYEYYVRAICTSENSPWVGPFTFRTICNALPTPFIETFDSNSTTETCWTIVNGNGDGNDWNLNQPANPIFGDQMAALFTGSNGNNNDWLISPTLTVRPGQRLRFYYKTLSSDFEEDLKVMLSVNGVATDQFTTILYENNLVIPTDATGTVAGSNTITLTSTAGVQLGDRVDIPGWVIPYGSTVVAINGLTITISGNADVTASGPLNVTFVHEVINNTVAREKVIELTGITTNTNVNIAFHTPFFPPNPWNYRGQYTFIDNVIVEDIPACPSVINVTTTNIVDTSAQINWETTGSETSWQISVQPFGTPAPTGNTLPAYLHTATAHPYMVTGLTPATKYQYYVRAICSGTSESVWVGPFEFTTRCDYTNLCQYTITVTNGNTGQVTNNVSVMQNGVEVQALEFPGFGQTSIDYPVFLCTGVEFNLYWNGFGSGVQYSQAQIVIRDEENNVVWTSPLGLGTVNTNIYTGISTCGVITCPQPTNLSVSNQGVLSWTPGGSETQWEVFVQPLNNGTLPQSGQIVSSTNYTPVSTDFTNATSGTYEYFVRAICSSTDKSYWSGPKAFVRNDEPSTAVRLSINNGATCEVSGVDASFIGATPSATPTACAGVNGGDIWYDFVATSKIHIIELSDFAPGSYYDSSYEGPWPKIIMTLYEVQTNGSLIEKGCSENNSFVASYSSELVVGTTYKIRLKLNDVITNNKTFNICITTPTDLCDLNAFNYDFEKLPMQNVTGVSTIIDGIVVPGWRTNTEWGAIFFQEASNSMGGLAPYSGGQCLQLVHDNESQWNPGDPNIKGLYKDFDTSEIIKMDYSFASATRTNGSTVELWAGPLSGPFTLVTQDFANSVNWELIQGSYVVPAGQNMTRFIFRTKEYAIGHLLDAANFKANTKIITQDATISCNQSVNVEAVGVGQWIADANNPAATIIADADSMTTTISGFNTPGTYIFHWKTRYCDEILTITYQGINDLAVVNTPVEYCQTETAVALTATAPSGYTLQWFTVPVGGTGDSNAPIPSTATVGTTVYYVALVDSNGCFGPRTPIDVVVNDLITPVVDFTYDATTYCTSGSNPILVPATNFTVGGNYGVTPNGLTIDATTGAINLATSTPGTYEVTYDLPRVDCTLDGSSSYILTVVQDVTYNLESDCDSQVMFLNVEPTNGSDLTNVDYTWQDANGNTIGSNTPNLNINDYLAQNSNVTLPTTISVTVTIGGCTSSKTFPLVANECSLIPRGISPNGDGDNDSFDLTGLGAKEVSIFNRYGTEVYSYSGNYTNQWNGNGKNGSQLPDGTYFYNITFQDGKSVTGWVYIIRQY